jgi:hypothetical protein
MKAASSGTRNSLPNIIPSGSATGASIGWIGSRYSASQAEIAGFWSPAAASAAASCHSASATSAPGSPISRECAPSPCSGRT